MDKELMILIIKTWENDPEYKTVVDDLKQILEEKSKNDLNRIDFLGQQHPETLANSLAKYPNINSDSLKQILNQLKQHKDQQFPTSLNNNSYLGSGEYSLLRTEQSIYQDDVQHSLNGLMCRKHFGQKEFSLNIVKHLQARKFRGPVSRTLPTEIFADRFKLYRKLMGHLSSVYCVSFDQTGQYIFTGADDHLIKIWSALDGRLLKTLRGHDGEITDMSVNFENRLLASGGMDKIIRIWDLKTTKLIECLNAHQATVTSVRFAPYNRHENYRYLISTSNDGSVIFWQYDAENFGFKKYKKFKERTRPGGQIVCCSFSSGGSFLACGSSDHCIHLYGFHPTYGPYWIAELDIHQDQVDSIQFANQGIRFVSGSQDGTAAIWSYKLGNWVHIKLDMLTQLDQTVARPSTERAKPRVLIVQWSRDDRYVMTSIVDYSIKIWDSTDGTLLHILRDHKHDVYLIESHPIDPRIIVTGSHDGSMIIWDVERAKVLKKFYNQCPDTHNEAPTLAQIYDLKFSPDGNMIATTDSYGYLTLYGNGGADPYKHVPDQLFFHTDYRALIRDMRHFVMDEQTHEAPHLMPRPVLVDMNGNPYNRAFQRFVPDYRIGELAVVAPLSDIQNTTLADFISDHSRLEDEIYLAEKMSRDSASTEIESDDATVIDSDATEIDEPLVRASQWARYRTRSSAQRAYIPRDPESSRPTRRSSARLRDRKRQRRM